MTSALPFDDFRNLLASLPPADTEAEARVHTLFGKTDKPQGSLGRIEDIAAWLAAWSGRAPPAVTRPLVAVFAGNHGITRHAISPRPMMPSAPLEAFRSGTQALRQGKTDQAITELEFAAEQGVPGAIWKLGRMYADGDGVRVNKARAYEYFRRLTTAYGDDSSGTPHARYLANAFVALGQYYLEGIPGTLKSDPNLANLMLTTELREWLRDHQTNWRSAIGLAQEYGIAVPAMAASLAYFDSYRTANLPQNLTQAQRDFFGAHTYHRIDKPELGAIHTDWESELT